MVPDTDTFMWCAVPFIAMAMPRFVTLNVSEVRCSVAPLRLASVGLMSESTGGLPVTCRSDSGMPILSARVGSICSRRYASSMRMAAFCFAEVVNAGAVGKGTGAGQLGGGAWPFIRRRMKSASSLSVTENTAVVGSRGGAAVTERDLPWVMDDRRRESVADSMRDETLDAGLIVTVKVFSGSRNQRKL